MKRVFSLITFAVIFSVTVLVNASTGSLLDLEEEIVRLFVDRGEYSAFAMMLSDDIRAGFQEEQYKKFKKDIAAEFGKIKYRRLRIFQKMDDADVLQYEVFFSKSKVPYMYEFAFNIFGGRPLLINFGLTPMNEIENKK